MARLVDARAPLLPLGHRAGLIFCNAYGDWRRAMVLMEDMRVAKRRPSGEPEPAGWSPQLGPPRALTVSCASWVLGVRRLLLPMRMVRGGEHARKKNVVVRFGAKALQTAL